MLEPTPLETLARLGLHRRREQRARDPLERGRRRGQARVAQERPRERRQGGRGLAELDRRLGQVGPPAELGPLHALGGAEQPREGLRVLDGEAALDLDLSCRRLLRGEIVLESVTVHAPRARIERRPDGAVDVLHVVRPGPTGGGGVAVEWLQIRGGRCASSAGPRAHRSSVSSRPSS
jgi:hypothetical protein